MNSKKQVIYMPNVVVNDDDTITYEVVPMIYDENVEHPDEKTEKGMPCKPVKKAS